jgi:hypothetical protein
MFGNVISNGKFQVDIISMPGVVTGGLTDDELRDSDVKVSLDSEVVATTSVANSTATGIIDALNETAEIVVSPGASTVGCQLTGTWAAVGDLVCFEGTVDGTNWTFIYANLTSLGSLAVMISGSNGVYQIAAAGMVKVRVRGYTWATPGSCSVSFNSSVGSSASLLALPLPAGSNVIGTVGISEDNKAQVVYEDGTILYVCKAIMGSLKASAVWQIKKVDGMDVTWCDGNALYDNVATSLAVVELLSFS